MGMDGCVSTGCSCSGHQWPGVRHIAPCCDEPHIDQVIDCGFFSLPWDLQEALMQDAAERDRDG